MGDPGQIGGYTQIFRDGRIEAVTVRAVVDRPDLGGRFIPVRDITSRVMKSLPDYLDALRNLEVSPPFAVMLSVTEVRGATLGVDDRQIKQPIQHDVLELPEILIEDYGTAAAYRRATRPAFDALWNAGGYSRAQDFNDLGDCIR
jgi:hypothetical protein